MRKIVYCADSIVRYRGGIILLRRVVDGGKIALPGGKQDFVNGIRSETLLNAALRELFEETGLQGKFVSVLGTYADDGRDPRGVFVSTVFVMNASGLLVTREPKKVQPFVGSRETLMVRRHEFAFDHADILDNYFRLF